MPNWPVVITDCCGDGIEVSVSGARVGLALTGGPVTLDAAQREAFAQAWAAACWKAEQQARPAPCGAVSPYAGPPCAEQDAHAEHVSRGPGGVVLARWPVSDGAPGPEPTFLGGLPEDRRRVNDQHEIVQNDG